MISVVIATRNGERTLPGVLDAYCRMEVPEGSWKLILVDNASTDRSREIIVSYQDRLPLTYLHEETLGKNAALNTAIDHIDGDLVVFTDDDVLPSPGWLVSMRNAADAHPSYSIFAGAVLPRWEIPAPGWITVGSSFLASRDWVAQSHPYLRRMMGEVGETTNLAILDGTEAVFIDQVQCRETIRTIVRLGSRVPLHASGVGKAIFATLPDEQIDAIVKVKGLARITDTTITSPETMWASLRVIRQRGYSFDDEEHLVGTSLRGEPDLRRARRVPGRDLHRRPDLAAPRRTHPAARADCRPHGGGAHAQGRRLFSVNRTV